jgi:hypothetical protein
MAPVHALVEPAGWINNIRAAFPTRLWCPPPPLPACLLVQIDAKKSVPQELKPKARKVFVGGLSPDTTEGAPPAAAAAAAQAQPAAAIGAFLASCRLPAPRAAKPLSHLSLRCASLCVPPACRRVPCLLLSVWGGGGGADHAGSHERPLSRLRVGGWIKGGRFYLPAPSSCCCSMPHAAAGQVARLAIVMRACGHCGHLTPFCRTCTWLPQVCDLC